MRTTYDYLFLSPHLDDVVLSCGSFIWQVAEAGGTVLVATFFAGDAPKGELPALARKAHELWGLQERVMQTRRSEDARACRELGADHVHMQLADCVYRRDPWSGEPLYPTQRDVFGAVHPADVDELPRHLAKLLQTLPSSDRVFGPLAIGNHVDHQILRLAVERSPMRRVSFYEDYPYCTGATRFAPPERRSAVNPVSDPALEHKLRAIRAYESQIRPLFSTEAEMVAKVTADMCAIGGERLWHPVEVDDG